MKEPNSRSPRPIPVLRPSLPDAAAIAPYLSRIDASRIYSNFGPLTREFESRLAERLSVPSGAVLSVSSGTTGLIAAILANANYDGGKRKLALIPSYSFVATAIAAERCGLQPYFVDVDPESWALDAVALLGCPALGRAAIVVAVAPYGRPLRQSEWIDFQGRTGIPVIFDSAAAFATVCRGPGDFLGPIPSVFSFHATKSFGVGEGGCIACDEPEPTRAMLPMASFGFDGSRESVVASVNGKMSEYVAAVGLAALDGWAEKLRSIERTAALYRARFTDAGMAGRFFGWPEVDGNYALLLCPDADSSDALTGAFDEADIEYRRWYGEGVHRHAHFAGAERGDLSVTEAIGRNLIGIPSAPDLSEESIVRVVEVAVSAVGNSRLKKRAGAA